MQDNFLECPICSQVFIDPILVMPCLHMYCNQCIKDWRD